MKLALKAAATLGIAFVFAFMLLHALPGDPRDRLEDRAIPAEQAERTRRALGLDEPLPMQLARTVGSYASADLGVSFTRHLPVAQVIGEALPYSIALGAGALVLAYGLGLLIAAGALAAGERAGTTADHLLLLARVIPRFWLAVVLVLVFHTWLGWLPASHAAPAGGGDAATRFRHLVLPVIALGLPAAANVARIALASALRVRASVHVRRARASGSAGFRLAAGHVLRPALAPVVALAGLDAPVLFSGALVVETAFAWPGVGRLAAESVMASDYPLALACTALAAAAVVLGRVASDTVARLVDPAAAHREGR